MLAVPMLAGAAALAAPTQAATRSYIVTDFDTIRLEAPIAVAVQTRRGTTARGDGDAELLERLDLSVSSRVLTIRLKRSPFEGRRSDQGLEARLFLTVPALRRVQLAGSGTLAVESMAAQSAELVASGNGMLSVGNFSGDTLSVMQQGAGTLRIAGRAAKALVQLSGSGAVDARALTASDLDVRAEGAGSVNALATRAARVVAVGPVTVTIEGHPACTVRHAGSGPVSCGGADF